MQNETRMPWDNNVSNQTSASKSDEGAYNDNLSVKTTETIGGKEPGKYGLGKPYRISFVGDVKHDKDK